MGIGGVSGDFGIGNTYCSACVIFDNVLFTGSPASNVTIIDGGGVVKIEMMSNAALFKNII